MKLLIKLLGGAGEYLSTLSEQTKLQISVLGVVVLLGCGGYKLYSSVSKLYSEPAKATPEQLIKPMEKLYSQTKAETADYFYHEKATTAQLDSLYRLIKKSKKP